MIYTQVDSGITVIERSNETHDIAYRNKGLKFFNDPYSTTTRGSSLFWEVSSRDTETSHST